MEETIPLKILSDVKYLHPQNGWTSSIIIGHPERNKVQHYIVAGYGPPLHFRKVLLEMDYSWKKRNGELSEYTEEVEKL